MQTSDSNSDRLSTSEAAAARSLLLLWYQGVNDREALPWGQIETEHHPAAETALCLSPSPPTQAEPTLAHEPWTMLSEIQTSQSSKCPGAAGSAPSYLAGATGAAVGNGLPCGQLSVMKIELHAML